MLLNVGLYQQVKDNQNWFPPGDRRALGAMLSPAPPGLVRGRPRGPTIGGADSSPGGLPSLLIEHVD